MKKTIFVLMAVVILAAGLFFYFKPVFSVNGQIIFRPEFETNLKAAQNAKKNSNSTSSDPEIDAAERILEITLTHTELWKEVDSKTLTPLLKSKITPALGSQAFMSAAENLYGLSPVEIRDNIVIPQAEEDIFKSQLTLNGQNFNDWISSAEKSAEVKIYFSDLKWNGREFVR